MAQCELLDGSNFSLKSPAKHEWLRGLFICYLRPAIPQPRGQSCYQKDRGGTVYPGQVPPVAGGSISFEGQGWGGVGMDSAEK